jgi:hypothetical protein
VAHRHRHPRRCHHAPLLLLLLLLLQMHQVLAAECQRRCVHLPGPRLRLRPLLLLLLW